MIEKYAEVIDPQVHKTSCLHPVYLAEMDKQKHAMACAMSSS